MINQQLNKLLKQAQGERTQNQFALHCGIGSSTLTRFIKGERVPTPEVLKKIASKSYNGVSYEDLMNAVYGTPNDSFPLDTQKTPIADVSLSENIKNSVLPLSEKEITLLDEFRGLLPEMQDLVITMMKNLHSEKVKV